jgi:hypothetical protein
VIDAHHVHQLLHVVDEMVQCRFGGLGQEAAGGGHAEVLPLDRDGFGQFISLAAVVGTEGAK